MRAKAGARVRHVREGREGGGCGAECWRPAPGGVNRSAADGRGRLRSLRYEALVRRGRGPPPMARRRARVRCMVPTRFVQQYTLRARLEPSGSHKAVEGGTGHAGDLGDGGLGDAQLEEAPDVVLLAVEP